MQEPKPTADPSALLHNIRRLSQEAEWDGAELDAALREGGVDPDRLASRVVADIQRHLSLPIQAPPRPLLVALRDATRLPPSAIAEAMEAPVTFLSMVSRHPRAVPTGWRRELARRAAQRLEIDQETVIQSFAAPFQFDRAASRDTPIPTDAVQDYNDILARSDLTPEARQFWRNLAEDA